jgi:hypothetical protein
LSDSIKLSPDSKGSYEKTGAECSRTCFYFLPA